MCRYIFLFLSCFLLFGCDEPVEFTQKKQQSLKDITKAKKQQEKRTLHLSNAQKKHQKRVLLMRKFRKWRKKQLKGSKSGIDLLANRMRSRLSRMRIAFKRFEKVKAEQKGSK